MRGRRWVGGITRDRLERICIEVNRPTDEGAAVLERVTTVLMEPPPVGIGLPSESVAPFMVTTAELTTMIEHLTETPATWLGVVDEIANRIRTLQ